MQYIESRCVNVKTCSSSKTILYTCTLIVDQATFNHSVQTTKLDVKIMSEIYLNLPLRTKANAVPHKKP